MPRGSAGRRVRFWPSLLRMGWIGGSAEHYLIATGDDRGIRIGFSAFWGRAIEVAPKKKCLEFVEFGEFSTSRRVHCKPSSSTDRSTDQANITQPRMKSAKKSGMKMGMKSKKPKKPRTTRRSDSLLPEELQRFQFQFPLPVENTHTHIHERPKQTLMQMQMQILI